MFRINRKGIAPLVLIVLALVGLVIGVWLVQNRTNFLPNAQFALPNLTKQTAFHLFLAQNYYIAELNNSVASNESSGGYSDSGQPEGNSFVDEGGIAPRRTWFYPGEEIRVNLAVSSDIDAANTFSAVINFPPDLLEIVTVQRENSGSITISPTDNIVLESSSTRIVGQGCKIGGCNGELCINEDGVRYSDCIYKEEYKCYQKAACEKQQNGQCGWTETTELKQCLAGGTIPEGQSCTDNPSGCAAGLVCQELCQPNPAGATCGAVGSVCKRPSLPVACPMHEQMCQEGTISTYVGDDNGCPLYKCLPQPDCRAVDCAQPPEGCSLVPDGSCCGRVACEPFPTPSGCPQIQTTACITKQVMCIQAPCPPREICQVFPSP